MILRWKEHGSIPALCTAPKAPPATATIAEGTQLLLLLCTLFGCYFPCQQGLFKVGAEPRMGTAVCPMPIIMPCTIPGASPPTQPGQHQELDEKEESPIHDLSSTP